MSRIASDIGFALVLGLVSVVTACGGSSSPAKDDGAPEVAADESKAPSLTERLAEAADALDDGDEGPSVGTVSFMVGGEAKTFGYVPEERAVYMSLATSIVARPEPGATETLSITISGIDLKTRSFPEQLPPARDRSQQVTIQQAMQSVGMSYMAADGAEWAGPARLQIESFGNDGVIRGTFDGVVLPHTDKELPDVTLTAGEFEATITSPW